MPAPRGSATEVLDRSGTAPVCPTCDYRMRAIDRCRAACRHCGEIVHVERWVVGLVMVTFGGRLIREVRYARGR